MIEPTSPPDDALVAGLFADPTRRAIYQFILDATTECSVATVADEFGLHRNAIRHHLEKLIESGLVETTDKRLNGRTGPGAGRPAKVYKPKFGAELTLHVPDRHYDMLASLLLRAIVSGDDLQVVGRAFGTELARSVEPGTDPVEGVTMVLTRLGFHPTVEETETGVMVSTGNCPFGRVALEAPNHEVCALDRAIISGLLEALGAADVTVTEHASIASGDSRCANEAVSRT